MNYLKYPLFLAFLLLSGVGNAQHQPEFAGTWELNTKKGENLGMVAAVKETVVIVQTEDKLIVDYADVFQGKTTTRKVIYDLTGAPVENYAAMGDKNETVSAWSEGVLVTTWTSEGAIAGTEVVRTEKRALSEDGQTMTVSRARGDSPALVLVYEKQ